MPKPERFVVITGGPTEGFEIYGPFNDPDDADAFGCRYCASEGWWLVRLHMPPGGKINEARTLDRV